MVDVGTIFAGVGMFTAIVMSLAVLILLARSRLVSTDDVNIEINDDPERALTVEAGGKLLTTLAKFAATMPVAGQIRLSEIEEELDTLSGWLLERFLYEKIAPERINGVAFIISHSRLVIERRRKAA